jgi:ribosome-binding factor A
LATRQEKLGKQLMRDMADIIDAATRQWFPQVLVTVMEVKLTPDLGLAKVYLSIFNADHPEKVLEQLNSEKGKIRHYLAVKIKNQVRKIPELAFFVDNRLDKAARIDELLRGDSGSAKATDGE